MQAGRLRLAATLVAVMACAVSWLAAEPSRRPRARPAAAASAKGLASYFSPKLVGRRMADGGRYDARALVAAHPTHPFGTLVRVTNLRNGKSVDVRIRDRGPGSRPRRQGVIIDLSRAAAETLDIINEGRAPVRVDVVSRGPSP